jgi:hypothetical protein
MVRSIPARWLCSGSHTEVQYSGFRLNRHFTRVFGVTQITQWGVKCSAGARGPQWTLTVSSSWLQALAMAASRLSVSMIGVPSAACRA